MGKTLPRDLVPPPVAIGQLSAQIPAVSSTAAKTPDVALTQARGSIPTSTDVPADDHTTQQIAIAQSSSSRPRVSNGNLARLPTRLCVEWLTCDAENAKDNSTRQQGVADPEASRAKRKSTDCPNWSSAYPVV